MSIVQFLAVCSRKKTYQSFTFEIIRLSVPQVIAYRNLMQAEITLSTIEAFAHYMRGATALFPTIRNKANNHFFDNLHTTQYEPIYQIY